MLIFTKGKLNTGRRDTKFEKYTSSHKRERGRKSCCDVRLWRSKTKIRQYMTHDLTDIEVDKEPEFQSSLPMGGCASYIANNVVITERKTLIIARSEIPPKIFGRCVHPFIFNITVY